LLKALRAACLTALFRLLRSVAFAGDKAQAGVQAEQMRPGFLTLRKSYRDEKLAEPRPTLPQRDVLLGLPGKRASEERRRIPGLIPRGASGLHALVLVPDGILDERIARPRRRRFPVDSALGECDRGGDGRKLRPSLSEWHRPKAARIHPCLRAGGRRRLPQNAFWLSSLSASVSSVGGASSRASASSAGR
jgi:hypothetical protein